MNRRIKKKIKRRMGYRKFSNYKKLINNSDFMAYYTVMLLLGFNNGEVVK